MLRYFFLGLIIIFLFSCTEKKPENNQDIDKKEERLDVDTPDEATQLTQLTYEFIEENKIDQWAQFIKFKDAVEDITLLNTVSYTHLTLPTMFEV